MRRTLVCWHGVAVAIVGWAGMAEPDALGQSGSWAQVTDEMAGRRLSHDFGVSVLRCVGTQIIGTEFRSAYETRVGVFSIIVVCNDANNAKYDVTVHEGREVTVSRATDKRKITWRDERLARFLFEYAFTQTYGQGWRGRVQVAGENRLLGPPPPGDLITAAARGDLDRLRSLLGEGADPNGADERGRTALHDAGAQGQLEAVRFLLDHGANVSAADERGRTALHEAAAQGQLEAVRFLLDHGANVSAADESGSTPLWGAAFGRHRAVAELLVQRGAHWDLDLSLRELLLDNTPPPGFEALFNGKDLTGWKGLVAFPPWRAKRRPKDLAAAQRTADESMRAHWQVVDGTLVSDGKGDNLCTAKDYGDFELLVDWKILPGVYSGIYLRGSPQVQIWQHPVGSGGLLHNQKNPSSPLKVADNPVEQWNHFAIRMIGEKVSVWLNGVLVVDNVTLENYWKRDRPIYPTGQIELQNHGNTVYFRNVYLKEIPR